MKVHVTSFFYNLDKIATPMIKIVSEDGIENYIPLNRNKNIKVTHDYGKKCIGFFKDKKFHPCPEKAIIEFGRQCKTCKKIDGFNVCARCNGNYCSASADKRDECFNKTHFLYITLIGDKIKVGITKSARYLKRWIEQGSDYSCLISSGNGIQVRRKEHKLSKEITDKIKTTKKIKMFMTDNKQILIDFLKEKKLEVPIINVRKYYQGLDLIPKTPSVYDGLLDGRIVCVKGKIIVFEKEKEYYFYNMNDLIARVVDIEI